jgi:uncharacterized membrane protein
MLGKLLAGILGLMAFGVCIFGGLFTGARAEVAIVRGLQAMVLFALLGWVIGWAAETVVRDQVRKEALRVLEDARKQQRPPEAGEAVPTAEPSNGNGLQ